MSGTNGPQITSDNNYVIGRGRIFFNKFADGTLIGTGEMYFGNTPSLEYTQAQTDLKHYSSEQGLKIQDGAVTLQKDITAQFQCDNIEPDNLALWWGADVQTVTQATTTGGTVEEFTVQPGAFYQIGVTDDNPMGVSNLDPATFAAAGVVLVPASATVTFSAQPVVGADTLTINGEVVSFINANTAPEGLQVPLGGNFAGTAQNLLQLVNSDAGEVFDCSASGNAAVITLTATVPGVGGNALTLAQSSAGIAVSGATFAGGSAGASAALVAGRDWNPDPDGGRFQIVDGGDVAAGSVIAVTYNTDAAVTTLINTNEVDIYGSLRFVADNPVGNNTDYFFPYVILRSNGNMQQKGDTWQEMTFTAEVLKLPTMARMYSRVRPGTGEG